MRSEEDTDIAVQPKEAAMLAILLATCETTLQAFQATDNPLDAELRQDLERVIERTRRELDALRGSGS